MKQVIEGIGEFFSKFPHLPKTWQELIAKLAPYINIISIVFTVFAGIAIISVLFGFGMLGAVSFSGKLVLPLITIAVNLVLSIMAIPGLFKRQEYAWNLMFYSALLSLVTSVLQGALIAPAVTLLITLYVLFEIRSQYGVASVEVEPTTPEQPLAQ